MKTFNETLAEALDEFQDVYGMDVTEIVFASFAEVLAACTPLELSYAAVEHLKSSKFAPRPAELLAIVKLKRDRESLELEKENFWQKTEEARQQRATRGYRRPEGMSVLDYVDQLMSQGMTREQAVNEVCN